MGGSKRFWIGLAVFQVAFGLTVFAATRAYYRTAWHGAGAEPLAASQPLVAWPGPIAGSTSAFTTPEGPVAPMSPASAPAGMDPAALSQQADAYFANQQYVDAADLYQRLLALAPDNVDVRNNLGLTLHYVGRSDDALRTLEQGVAIDPTHQRSWLTIGFINSQLGNTGAAREALSKAAEVGDDAEVRRAAREMLTALP